MYVDAFVDMSMAGRITGACKPFDRGRQTYAFAAGTQKLYDFLNNNPECMAAPVSYVNDIARVSQIEKFTSINGAVDIDLYGQVSSESSGINHISGAAGSRTSSWARTWPRAARASSAAPRPSWTRSPAS